MQQLGMLTLERCKRFDVPDERRVDEVLKLIAGRGNWLWQDRSATVLSYTGADEPRDAFDALLLDVLAYLEQDVLPAVAHRDTKPDNSILATASTGQLSLFG